MRTIKIILLFFIPSVCSAQFTYHTRVLEHTKNTIWSDIDKTENSSENISAFVNDNLKLSDEEIKDSIENLDSKIIRLTKEFESEKDSARKAEIKIKIDKSKQDIEPWRLLLVMKLTKKTSVKFEKEAIKWLEEYKATDAPSWKEKFEEKYEKEINDETTNEILKFLLVDYFHPKNSWIYILHRDISQIAFLNVELRSNFRSSEAISAQGIAGIVGGQSTEGDGSANYELGAKISNTRVTLGTKIKYSMEKSDDGKFVLTKKQKDRYLYFDFISRGLLAFDSLKTTMTEYINSSVGSPITVRWSNQFDLSNKWSNYHTSGIRQPKKYITIDVDSRLIPVVNETVVDGVGVSLNIMPSFIFSTSSGSLSSRVQEDTFLFQFTGNFAVVSDNVLDVVVLEGGSKPSGNLLISAEGRLGNFSTINSTRNWSVFFKYSFQDLIGSKFSFGFSFAPQGEGKAKN